MTNLYRTEPLPIYEPLLERHMQIQPESMYMAVSESRQYYSLLTPADLCVRRDYSPYVKPSSPCIINGPLHVQEPFILGNMT